MSAGNGLRGDGTTLRRLPAVIVVLNDNDMSIAPARRAMSARPGALYFRTDVFGVAARIGSSFAQHFLNSSETKRSNVRNFAARSCFCPVHRKRWGGAFFDELGFSICGTPSTATIRTPDSSFCDKSRRNEGPRLVHVVPQKAKVISREAGERQISWRVKFRTIINRRTTRPRPCAILHQGVSARP